MTAITAQDVRRQVARVLDEPGPQLRDDEDLLDRGLDSLRLMSLVTAWQEAGADVDFADLAEEPTLAHWIPLLTHEPVTRPQLSPHRRSDPPEKEVL